jgi:antitoxin ParD1/3/4
MTKNTSISLGDHFSDFIDAQVSSGRFGTASEVVRAGLRLLEEREAKLTKLRELIREGDESGPGEPFDLDEFLAEMHANAARDA